ncbi:hypothetical protein K501DRAFT_274568 [Backusella circina FSU 941]|nr:hypothetical protein K501DRAFT_274568 [Backusella circina FSU 941]
MKNKIVSFTYENLIFYLKVLDYYLDQGSEDGSYDDKDTNSDQFTVWLVEEVGLSSECNQRREDCLVKRNPQRLDDVGLLQRSLINYLKSSQMFMGGVYTVFRARTKIENKLNLIVANMLHRMWSILTSVVEISFSMTKNPYN